MKTLARIVMMGLGSVIILSAAACQDKGVKDPKVVASETQERFFQRTDATLHDLLEKGSLHTLADAFGQDNSRPQTDDAIIGLALQGTQVTDAGLRELAALKNLTTLYLGAVPGGHSHITDMGLKEVVTHKNLTNLSLSGTKVTDAGLKELATLEKLTTLDLGNTQVTDVGLKELATLKNLTTLDLRNTQVTDVGLKGLAAHKSLLTLRLDNTSVADAGLKELAALKNLSALDLSGTRVTSAGVKELKKHLPNLTVMPFGLDSSPATAQAVRRQHDLTSTPRQQLAAAPPTVKSAAAAQGQEKKSTSKAIDPETVSAYEKLGGTYGRWHDRGRYFEPDSQHSLGITFPNDAQEGLPGFQFGEFPGMNLPEVAVPFILDFTNSNVTDGGLKQLRSVKNIATLALVNTRVTDAGLKELAALQNLTALYLGESVSVTDGGLKELAVLKNLSTLDLSGTKVTDKGLEELAALKNLRKLTLTGTRVTNTGLKHLAPLTNLGFLGLPRTVTDGGLKELAVLKNLSTLDLSGTKVTDAGLKHLAPLTNLATLSLEGTKVTSTGVGELKEHLPNIKIFPLGLVSPPATVQAPATVESRGGQGDEEAVRKLVSSGYSPINKALALRGPQVTDDVLKTIPVLKDLKGLEELTMEGTKVTDTDLKGLKRLDLEGTAVTDTGLKNLAGLNELRSLTLSNNDKVTDAGLKEIARLNNIDFLTLYSTQVTGAGLREVAGLYKLQRLQVHLRGACLTGADLKPLCALTSLEYLDLSGTPVTGVAIRELAGLPRLNQLGLPNEQITDGMLRALRETGLLLRALPGVAMARRPALPQTVVSVEDYDRGVAATTPRRLAQPQDVVSVFLRDAPITDAGLKELADFKNLLELDLRGTKVTEAGIKELAGLKQLHTLKVTGITDGMLRVLREAGLLHALEEAMTTTDIYGLNSGQGLPGLGPKRPTRPEDVLGLRLARSAVTDTGLKELVGLKNLRRLDLQTTRVTDAGLKTLATFENLEDLNLGHTQVTLAGLKGLAAFKNLRKLDLQGTRVTDAAMQELTALTNLRALNLRHTLVTNAGLKELAGLPNLQDLLVGGEAPAGLRGGGVTTAGLKELQELKRGPIAKASKGPHLLITSAAFLGHQIFRINTDGSGRTQLTVEGTGASDPAPSPDGNLIAFVAGGQLCVMNADGSGGKRVAKRADIATLAPSWSPDGKQIAFTIYYRGATGGSFHSQLYVVDANGRNLRSVGNVGGMLPAWSPDGKRLLFASMDGRGGVSVMDVNGTNVRELVKDALMAAWSPDGQSLAYVILGPGGPGHDRPAESAGLYVARADGSMPRCLRTCDPAENFLAPRWSADGKRLFLTRTIWKSERERGAAVYAIDIDGRNYHRVTAEDTVEYLGGSFGIAMLLGL
jgi:Leucine-rich repeat (LRR) protein